MAKVFITRKIPETGIQMIKDQGHEVVVSEKKKRELVEMIEKYS